MCRILFDVQEILHEGPFSSYCTESTSVISAAVSVAALCVTADLFCLLPPPPAESAPCVQLTEKQQKVDADSFQ